MMFVYTTWAFDGLASFAYSAACEAVPTSCRGCVYCLLLLVH